MRRRRSDNVRLLIFPQTCMRTVAGWLAALIVGLLVISGGGCVSSEQTEASKEQDSAESVESSVHQVPALAEQSSSVRTVQLYRGEDERSLPVISLGGSEALRMEFDLMADKGRPLSVYFYHADRNWTRDLSSSQFLESYHNDNLLDYQRSQGTEIPYVHYVYQFPNRDIRFRLSGNYIVRVTEKGRQDSVLFERAFFISEEVGSLKMQSRIIQVPGQFGGAVRPATRYSPPRTLTGDPFGYTTCFVRNGRLSDTRCQDRPLLVQQPDLEFELDRDRAFAPVTADYRVDLGNLRSAEDIVGTDLTVSPFRVRLEPDYAQFSGRDVTTSLNGQIVVREAVIGRANPALTAEYVEVTFSFVPPNERPFSEPLVVAGSFSGMDPERGVQMTWVPTRSQYEGSILLKQGKYQYFYSSSDPRFQETVRRSQSRYQSTFTTLVYYDDPGKGTDRLLRMGSFRR